MRKFNYKIWLAALAVVLALVFVRMREIEVLKTCIDKETHADRGGDHLIRFIIWRNEETGSVTSDMVSTEYYYSTHIGRQYRVHDWEFYIKKY